jgi:hypothetical protein
VYVSGRKTFHLMSALCMHVTGIILLAPFAYSAYVSGKKTREKENKMTTREIKG